MHYDPANNAFTVPGIPNVVRPVSQGNHKNWFYDPLSNTLRILVDDSTVKKRDMVTGESRPYQTNQGNIGRLLPADPFLGGDGGRGAFEVAFRVSYLDLEDKDVRGGRLLDLTWGFNWYATRNARVLGNIIWADPKRVEGSTWIAQVRLQWAL